jgi:aldehyde dehydrogenase (NAD+)
VDKIAFTGSCATGQRIIEMSAASVKKVTMELGGKSPNIIFADADRMPRSRGGDGVYNNSGQVCAAGTRLFVERAVYDEVVSRYGALASALKVGPALIPPRSLARWCRPASMNGWQTIWRLARRKGRGW